MKVRDEGEGPNTIANTLVSDVANESECLKEACAAGLDGLDCGSMAAKVL